ncbi:sickle tail protein homolog [Carlito syrichta]|uniref:Sickle tail protein homolog n=1 Tax=Carlito syrichta TaxID=1868482 RepID=A0A3Q0DRD6_CARSF|nr:sickle tail protein homolog [Carlito syrichta]
MEENESQKCEPCPPHSADSRQMQEQGKSNLHVTSSEDAECRRTKERLSNGNSRVSVSKSSRNIPRRHTLGGARSSKEILGMQTSEMDRKREAFLEHLKQKYPHHASAIMGHQERLRDQLGRRKLAVERLSLKAQSSLPMQQEDRPKRKGFENVLPLRALFSATFPVFSYLFSLVILTARHRPTVARDVFVSWLCAITFEQTEQVSFEGRRHNQL